MKLFPVRTQALRLPALVLVCLLLVLGAVLGFAVCRAVPQQDRQELSDYLHQYAQATADGRGPSASALSVAAAYFRYPLAAALLGLTAADKPCTVRSRVQGRTNRHRGPKAARARYTPPRPRARAKQPTENDRKKPWATDRTGSSTSPAAVSPSSAAASG